MCIEPAVSMVLLYMYAFRSARGRDGQGESHALAAVEEGTAEMVTRQGQFEPWPPVRGAAGSSQGYGKGRRWRGAYAPGTATSASPRVMDEPVRSGQFSGSLGGTALCPKSDPVSNKHWPSLRSPASEGRPFQHPLTSNKGDHKY